MRAYDFTENIDQCRFFQRCHRRVVKTFLERGRVPTVMVIRLSNSHVQCRQLHGVRLTTPDEIHPPLHFRHRQLVYRQCPRHRLQRCAEITQARLL